MKIPEILAEENHFLVIKKPAGILCQGDYSNSQSLLDVLKIFLKEKYQKPGNVFLGLVHRLDKPVSGVMVFAKTSKGASRLSESFRQKSTEKFYLAVTSGPELKATTWKMLNNNLLRQKDVTVVCSTATKNTTKAILEYLPLGYQNGYSLILIKLHTGRKHQIRAQLNNLGQSIVGDQKYGSHEFLQNKILLHSCFLKFPHPIARNQSLKFFAEPPAYFKDFYNFTEDEMKNVQQIIEEKCQN